MTPCLKPEIPFPRHIIFGIYVKFRGLNLGCSTPPQDAGENPWASKWKKSSWSWLESWGSITRYNGITGSCFPSWFLFGGVDSLHSKETKDIPLEKENHHFEPPKWEGKNCEVLLLTWPLALESYWIASNRGIFPSSWLQESVLDHDAREKNTSNMLRITPSTQQKHLFPLSSKILRQNRGCDKPSSSSTKENNGFISSLPPRKSKDV